MANSTADIVTEFAGTGPFVFDLPVGSGAIYKHTLVSQLVADGTVQPFSTASSGTCVGIALHGAAASGRVRIMTKIAVVLANGAGGDAFSETSQIGSIVYASDDHTVADNSNSLARKAIGYFLGMESDGKVRVWLDPQGLAIVNALQGLADAPATADALRDAIVAAFG